MSNVLPIIQHTLTPPGMDGIRKPPCAGDRFLILIAGNDAPLIGERAATRGHVAMEAAFCAALCDRSPGYSVKIFSAPDLGPNPRVRSLMRRTESTTGTNKRRSGKLRLIGRCL